MRTKEDVFSRDHIVSEFTSGWEYRLDKEQYGASDAWKIIYAKNTKGKYVGDCEDYALSILWRLSGESKLKNVVAITHSPSRYLFSRSQ